MIFADKIAVVTGAGMGIGRAIARQMADQGATIVIVDINGQSADAVAQELTNSGGKAHSCHLNITKPNDVDSAMQGIIKEYGAIDILVNNAGVCGDEHPVHEMTTEQWHRVMDVNLHAVFYCSRAVLPSMLKSKSGRIINISSIGGKEGVPNIADYCSAKAGAIEFTKCLAKEVARQNITVNCVTPGLTDDTDMAKGFTAEQKAIKLGKVPMERMALPDEVAAVVVFLASAAAAFVTGAVYDVTGGRSDY